MMPGDIPCEKPCHNTLCHYCAFGQCTDNAPCEERLPMPEPSESDTEDGDDDSNN